MSTYYPIGSIVRLYMDENKLFMITGYFPKHEDNEGVFDYFAVPFPYGMTDDSKYICFNREGITEVVHTGYCDEECKEVLEGFDQLVVNFKEFIDKAKEAQENKETK